MKITASHTVTEIQLSYKNEVEHDSSPVIQSSRDTFEIIRPTWDDNTIQLREEMKLVLLNRASRVLGILSVLTGGVSGTVADPKLIFARHSRRLQARSYWYTIIHWGT
jgi:DNA repair protein RadC